MEAIPCPEILIQIINAVADPIFIQDREHRVVMVNDACCQFNRRSREELVGKTARHLYPSPEAEVMQANSEKVFLTGQEHISEEMLTDARGMVHIVAAKKSLYQDDSGHQWLVVVIQDNRENDQPEAALQESGMLYQSLIRDLPCGVFRKDAGGRYIFANAHFLRCNHLAAGELLGRTPPEVTVHLAIRPDVRASEIISQQRSQLGFQGEQNHQHIMRTGETIVLDEILTLPDGTVKYFQAVKSPVRDAAGRIIGSQGVQFDITGRKQAEKALRQSEDRHRILFNHSQNAILLNGSPDGAGWPGKFVEVNDVACRRLGYAREELLQLTPLAIIAPERLPKMPPILAKLQAEGHVVWESVDITKDGRRIPVEVHSHMIELNGQSMMMSETRDLTEWKQSEEQLRKLSRAMEQSPVSIVITNPKGNIEYVNPKFVSVTGYTLAEVVGKNPRFLKSNNPAVDQVKQYKQLWATILRGNEWHGEFQNRKKNGELFWELASISPVTDPDGKITHFLAVKEDITHQKLLEAEFRQAQKMEAFGSLAAGVAHDFNNMLTAILCSTQILEIGNPLDDYQKEALNEITEAANRAASLTRQLLMFSRRQTVQLKALELNGVTEGISKMLRRLIGENISLKARYGTGGTPVFADPNMLEQVLLNLSVNSRDAMPKGGELTIATEALTITEATGRRRLGRFIRLSVSDTGMGISEKNLEHIFEPFFTTKEVGKGTGLGLATVFGIVEQHHGWIEVESVVGTGTTFHIFLPRHEAAPEVSFIQRPKIAERGGKETILLVEDELSVRTLARNILTRHGYQVYEAGSGAAALEVWKQHQSKIDALFTDMVMPGQMNGLELGQKLLADKRGLKVVYTSGYTDEMLNESSLLRQTSFFLDKPYSPDALLRMLRKALD